MIMLLFPVLLSAQYWGERVTEKSFESSNLQFNSYYFNPFGIGQFKDATVGLLDDPFVNLYLNPAAIAPDSLRRNYLYIDFRGDRTEQEITSYAAPMNYYDARLSFAPVPPDPRWYSETRSEPEALFSAAIITYPLQKRFMVAATYQFIYKEEPFYQPPTYIYNSRYGYDANSKAMIDESSVPVIDRSSGQDEMLTSAHLFSLNAATSLTGRLDLGFGLNAVRQERDGSYGRLDNDQYSSQENQDWYNLYSTDKNQDYSHIDLNGGLRYQFNDAVTAGFKLGYLQGKATQKLNKIDTSSYTYDYSDKNWNRSLRSALTNQSWNRDGGGFYGGVQVEYQINPGRRFIVSLSQDNKETDLDNSSFIIDTSYYAGHWESSYGFSDYYSHSRLSDRRAGSGKSELSRRQARLALISQESARAAIHIGLYLLDEKTTTATSEPVTSRQHSYSSNNGWWIDSDNDTSRHNYLYSYQRDEDKRLEWKYVSERQSLQIPVIVEFKVAQNWQLMFGVNRIWNRWKIEDQTTAWFTRRMTNDNGKIETETNFGERYTEPRQILTDNTTDFIAGLKIDLSPTFGVNLLVDPQIEPEWRVAQWWLGFKLGL
jgi:hypothetical protein